MYYHVGEDLNIKLLDSLNFLNMPLFKLPKSFGLHEFRKGYFPHLYNTEEINSNESKNYLVHLPDISYYDTDNRTAEKHDEFLLWYEENRHCTFDLQHELLLYCRFLPEVWGILLKKNALNGCTHESWECKCQWNYMRKCNGDVPLEILHTSGEWVIPKANNVLISRFVTSPVGLIPPHDMVEGKIKVNNAYSGQRAWKRKIIYKFRMQCWQKEKKLFTILTMLTGKDIINWMDIT